MPLARYLIFHNAAVDIFFCLSSFTLCLVYQAGSRRRLSYRNFAVARIARIYPVYLLGLLLMVAILIVFNPAVFSQNRIERTVLGLVWQALLLAVLPIRSLMGFWDIPGWSVSVEALCYALIFPLLFSNSRRSIALSPLLLISAIFTVVALDFFSFENAYQASVLAIGYGAAPREISYWVPIIRGAAMFLSGWLAYLLFRSATRLTAVIGTITDLISALFIMIVVLASLGHGDRQLVVFLAPMLIVGLMNHRTLTSRLLSTPPFVFAGRISYSLYLVHVPVLIAYHLHPLFPVGHPSDFYAPFLMSLTVAIVSYTCLEGPARRLIRRRLGRFASVA